MLEAAERLEEIGAGIQLSPNASRILIALGLRERLAPHVVAPEELKVMNAALRTGAGARAARCRRRATLRRAVLADPSRRSAGGAARGGRGTCRISRCSSAPRSRISPFATTASPSSHPHRMQPIEEHGAALIGADGLWSTLRDRLGHAAEPDFAHHTAWRALVAADAAPPQFAAPAVNLWLGRDAHLVHYPVKAGRLINVVAIMRDDWDEPGWSAPGTSAKSSRAFPPTSGTRRRANLSARPQQWQKWALYDCAPLEQLGARAGHAARRRRASDAALSGPRRRDGDRGRRRARASAWRSTPDDAAGALRRLRTSAPRAHRTHAARGTPQRHASITWAASGPAAHARAQRHAAPRLIRRYDWLYDWRPT